MLYIIVLAAAFVSLLLGASATSIVQYLYDSKRLRRFPSLSPLAGLTNLPWLWSSITLRRYKDLHEAHKQHTVVRVGPNILSFNDAVAAATIYGHGSPAVKAPFYDAGAGHYRNLADTRNKEEHSQKRRLLASGYALTTLIRWEDKVVDRVQALVAQYDARCLERRSSRSNDAFSLDHRRWMDIFTIDIINDIGLSAGMKLLENGDDVFEVQGQDGEIYKTNYRQALWKGLEVHASYAWLPEWYGLFKRLTWWDRRWQSSTAYNDIVTTQCKRRIDRYLAGESLDDFFAYLLESKGGRMNMLELGEMVAECSVMLNAGSETTGIALTNCLFLLITNPDCLEKLRHEVEPVFEGSDAIVPPFEKVRYLPYLKACLDENLRLHPPSATTTPRITPKQGQEIQGEWIAGDTVVFCPTYSLHRNARYFQDPNAFRPERWLGEEAKQLQQAFLPFSLGSRGCIGRNISYMEQQMVIASLVHRFDFELISSNWKPTYTEAVTCSPGPMPLRVFRRQR
jgi:cytochrome P450